MTMASVAMAPASASSHSRGNSAMSASGLTCVLAMECSRMSSVYVRRGGRVKTVP